MNIDKLQEIMKPARDAADKLAEEINEYVGSAYGTLKDGSVGPHIIIYSNNENLEFPTEYEGFEVTRNNIPVAQ